MDSLFAISESCLFVVYYVYVHVSKFLQQIYLNLDAISFDADDWARV